MYTVEKIKDTLKYSFKISLGFVRFLIKTGVVKHLILFLKWTIKQSLILKGCKADNPLDSIKT